MHARFCSQCGHPLVSLRPEGDSRERLVCAACGTIAYRNAKPCAGVLPTHEGRLLLGRRGVAPYLGHWDLIGGFMEHDETPEAAALREGWEETGLRLKLVHLLGIYTDTYSDQGISTLNVYYVAHLQEGRLQANDDVVELRWFGPDELPADPAFPGHTLQVLADWTAWLQRQRQIEDHSRR